MRGFAPSTPTRDGRPWTHSPDAAIAFFVQRAGDAWEYVVIRGHGGILPPAGCKASGKTRKNAGGESSLSPSRRFLVLIVPVKIVVPFPKLLALKRCFHHMPLSHTGVQRSLSSGAGYRGRGAPCFGRGIGKAHAPGVNARHPRQRTGAEWDGCFPIGKYPLPALRFRSAQAGYRCTR